VKKEAILLQKEVILPPNQRVINLPKLVHHGAAAGKIVIIDLFNLN